MHKLLTEGELGCLMIRIPDYDGYKILEWSEKSIPASVLTDSGLEREVHTTVAYGFSPDVYALEVFDAVKKITGNAPVQLKLGTVGRFATNPKFDVIKVAIESPQMVALHRAIRGIFGERLNVSYADFKPHLTLAYVKKGACPFLDGHGQFVNELFNGRVFVYSSAGRKQKTEFVVPLTEAQAVTSLAG